MSKELGEPKIHSHMTDELPGDHPRAYDCIMCDAEGCKNMLHASNNECMQTWIETDNGNFCTDCFKLGKILKYGLTYEVEENVQTEELRNLVKLLPTACDHDHRIKDAALELISKIK